MSLEQEEEKAFTKDGSLKKVKPNRFKTQDLIDLKIGRFYELKKDLGCHKKADLVQVLEVSRLMTLVKTPKGNLKIRRSILRNSALYGDLK